MNTYRVHVLCGPYKVDDAGQQWAFQADKGKRQEALERFLPTLGCDGPANPENFLGAFFYPFSRRGFVDVIVGFECQGGQTTWRGCSLIKSRRASLWQTWFRHKSKLWKTSAVLASGGLLITAAVWKKRSSKREAERKRVAASIEQRSETPTPRQSPTIETLLEVKPCSHRLEKRIRVLSENFKGKPRTQAGGVFFKLSGTSEWGYFYAMCIQDKDIIQVHLRPRDKRDENFVQDLVAFAEPLHLDVVSVAAGNTGLDPSTFSGNGFVHFPENLFVWIRPNRDLNVNDFAKIKQEHQILQKDTD